MCFHIGSELARAYQADEDSYSLDILADISDDMYASKEKVHRKSFGQIVSRLRSIISAVVTIKWILFILWACF